MAQPASFTSRMWDLLHGWRTTREDTAKAHERRTGVAGVACAIVLIAQVRVPVDESRKMMYYLLSWVRPWFVPIFKFKCIRRDAEDYLTPAKKSCQAMRT